MLVPVMQCMLTYVHECVLLPVATHDLLKGYHLHEVYSDCQHVSDSHATLLRTSSMYQEHQADVTACSLVACMLTALESDRPPCLMQDVQCS